MKKGFTILIAIFSFFCVHAQEKVKDTVKTEVVNVVTTYNPKIADASKIKKNPKITLLEKSEKKKLSYSIFSAPVASTFIPKSGTLKGINLGIRERVYNNYIAAGFGNYASPYVEAFLSHSTHKYNEFGVSAKYAASQESIKNSILNSNFSNFEAGLFYKQEERYFDWKLSLNSEFSKYNWYGLPADNNFTTDTINSIEEEQAYSYFQLVGDLDFIDSSFDFGQISVSHFSDSFKSSEGLIQLNTKLDLPLDFIQRNLNDLQIKADLEFLTGEFKNDYLNLNPINYSFFTTTLLPEYKISASSFSLNTGIKLVASLDAENNNTNFYVFPEVNINIAAIQNYLNIYGGATGGLTTNTYKGFTEVNPYVSPTLLMKQTVEKTNFFAGLNGEVSNGFSFNLKVNIKDEEDKPLFIRNNSKSDGTVIVNSTPLKGYEYGNSFGVIYDDVKTTTIFAELELDLTKTITLGANMQQNSYITTNAISSYNLPDLQASVFGKYNNEKWYITTNIFYVGDRKDVIYSDIHPSNILETSTLDSFIDVNVNGGYHFNDKFSAFLKLNNILNTEYQRFANFNTQGFQVLGGITYKFDF